MANNSFGRRGSINMPNGKKIKGGFKYLIYHCKPYAWGIVIAILVSILSSMLAVFAPSFLESLTNEIYKFIPTPPTPENPNPSPPDYAMIWNNIIFFALIMVIFYAGVLFSGITNTIIMSSISNRISKKMRSDITLKINKVPLSFFDTTQFGDTLSLITNDADTVSESISNSFATLISSTIQIIAVVIIMFIKSWVLALICVCGVPVMMLITSIYMAISQKVFAKQSKSLANVNAYVEEIYNGHNVIKAFNADEEVNREFGTINKNLYKINRSGQMLESIMMPIIFIVTSLSQVVVIIFGIILCIEGKIQLGGVIAFITYLYLFQQPFSQIAQMLGVFIKGLASCGRINKFIKQEEVVNEDDITRIITNVKGAIEFRHVKFGYNKDKIIINDFNLNVKPGQKIAIVGPTGAGKTTLVNLLMRFYELNSGDIFIDGIKTTDMKASNLRTLFAMVLQDTWLFNGTIYENLIFNNTTISKQKVVEVCKNIGLDHFIMTLPEGYDTILNESSTISSGEKQLLTIARAILQNCPLLILDEATSSVDTRTEEIIQKAMDHLTKNKTSFIIAHRLSTIKNADVILVLKDGDVIEQGNHQSLLSKNGFYAKLYNAQFSENS